MNKAEGEGTFSSDKVTYKGQWHNDLPHGEGQEIYSRISEYSGNFVNGKKSGIGRYQWNLGEWYQGEFKENKIHGEGKHVTKEYYYDARFENGEKNGQGFLRNTVKNWTYKGQFKNNKM
jgi:hypothetical protein